jgi:hypothetical protein
MNLGEELVLSSIAALLRGSRWKWSAVERVLRRGAAIVCETVF